MRFQEKRLDGNYSWMPQAVFCKYWKPHLTKQLLYGYLTPISQTNEVRRARYDEHHWCLKDEHISDFLHGLFRMDTPAFDNQQKLTFVSSVRIQDADLRTYRVRWPIQTKDEIESKESLLSAGLEDNDTDFLPIHFPPFYSFRYFYEILFFPKKSIWLIDRIVAVYTIPDHTRENSRRVTSV